MKKLVSLAVILALCASLFSCGDHSQPQTDASTTKSVSETQTTETTSQTETVSADTQKTETTAETTETAEETTVTATSETTEKPLSPTERGYVLYSDFGAKGDGTKDDFLPIFAAHAYANENGLPVKADNGATYLIGAQSVGREITVKTDTDWTGATFIIDDTIVEVNDKKTYTKPIFRIVSSEESRKITNITSLKKSATNIGFQTDQPCLAVIRDNKDRIFIRSGIHAAAGDLKQEIVLLDENGNIDPSTPLTFDYPSVNSIMLYPIDTETLTVRGGEFHTIVNKAPAKHTYFHRNIIVERSNVVLENITHTVEGETDAGGAPYHGFAYVTHATNVTVKDCVFTPHYIFSEIKSDGAATFGYDIHINMATNVRVVGCTQTIDINDTNYWGVFTSNFARNLTLEDCVLSRFDAHRGVYNATIKNCVFGHQGILFVGFGTFTIEDTTVRASSFVQLREDYGATFDGKLVIRNCRFEPQTKLNSKSELIKARNNCEHNYGYRAHFPTLEIDGLFIDDTNATSGYKNIYILPTFTETAGRFDIQSSRGYAVPETVTLRNITTASGRPYQYCRVSHLFANTTIIEE